MAITLSFLLEKAILTTTETVLKQINSNQDLLEQRSNLRFNSLEEQITCLLNNFAPLSPLKNSSLTRKPAQSTSSSIKKFPRDQLLPPKVSYQCDNCGKSFGSMQMLTDHIQAKHNYLKPC